MCKVARTEEGETKWEKAWRKTRERGEDECPICMCDMEDIYITNNASPPPKMPKRVQFSPAETENSDMTTLISGKSGLENDRNAKGVTRTCGETDSVSGPLRNPRAILGTICALRETGEIRYGQGGEGGGERRRARLLLSCSHMFHKAVSGERLPKLGGARERGSRGATRVHCMKILDDDDHRWKHLIYSNTSSTASPSSI